MLYRKCDRVFNEPLVETFYLSAWLELWIVCTSCEDPFQEVHLSGHHGVEAGFVSARKEGWAGLGGIPGAGSSLEQGWFDPDPPGCCH